MDRTIFHVDMDAFFVSVEELFDPALKGKPVVVGGKHNERGVVSAASYAARKFGVHSAMPLRTAYQLCPQAIFVEGRRERYKEYSLKVRGVLERFTPVFEMASIDEAYCDFTGTGRLHGPPMQAAHKLHEAMKCETGLNCSVGVSRSRLVAKVASDQAKPNGVLWIVPGSEAAFLAPLAVRKLPGVGQVAERQLAEIGVKKVGDLAQLDPKLLATKFGQWGLSLAGKAKGLDAGGWFSGEIGGEEAPKSVSHEHTFGEDTHDRTLLDATLTHLAEQVARRLRAKGLHARTLQVKIRYSDFSTLTRAQTLDHATQLDHEIARAARTLFGRNWTGGAIRLLGVQASQLSDVPGQLHLLEGDKNEKWHRALHAVDAMRAKFGEKSVSLAGGLQGRYRERVHEEMPDE